MEMSSISCDLLYYDFNIFQNICVVYTISIINIQYVIAWVNFNKCNSCTYVYYFLHFLYCRDIPISILDVCLSLSLFTKRLGSVKRLIVSYIQQIANGGRIVQIAFTSQLSSYIMVIHL